jgi:hypothetical protein
MFFTYYLLSTWQTEYGMDKIDLEEAAGHAAHDYFASWKKGPSELKTVAWEFEAIVQFTAFNNYVYSQEDTPDWGFIQSFAPAQQI